MVFRAASEGDGSGEAHGGMHRGSGRSQEAGASTARTARADAREASLEDQGVILNQARPGFRASLAKYASKQAPATSSWEEPSAPLFEDFCEGEGFPQEEENGAMDFPMDLG